MALCSVGGEQLKLNDKGSGVVVALRGRVKYLESTVFRIIRTREPNARRAAEGCFMKDTIRQDIASPFGRRRIVCSNNIGELC